MPIAGIEAYVAPGRRTDRTTSAGAGEERYAYHLTLLARNGVGFRNPRRSTLRAYLEGYYYKPRISTRRSGRHSEGFDCLSGCVGSEFSQLLLNDRKVEAENLAMWYYKTFGEGNFFVEVQNNDGFNTSAWNASSTWLFDWGFPWWPPATPTHSTRKSSWRSWT